MKRSQILLTMIERMMSLLSNQGEQSEITKNRKETVTENPKPEINVTKIIERGQHLLKDRSILFRTPKTPHKKKNLVPVTPKNFPVTPRSAKFSESKCFFVDLLLFILID